MGKKGSLVEYFCGVLIRKKNAANNQPIESPENEDLEGDISPKKPQLTKEEEEQNESLPPPPGRIQTRAASYRHQHSKSGSALSRFSASLSMRVRPKREECSDDKNVTYEDLVWKKTIIMGEKCRVPDEDDDTVVYDEKGNIVSTYHPRCYSRQNSGVDHHQDKQN